jgi:transposase
MKCPDELAHEMSASDGGVRRLQSTEEFVEEKKYWAAEMERILKIQEVIAKAMAGKLTWWEAAEIMGVTDRTMRRWRGRIEKYGYSSLYDRRKHSSPKRIPLEEAKRILKLYEEKYSDFNVRHFHEKLASEHQIDLSYTWVKKALQLAGLVRATKRGKHRRRRPRRPIPGMMLHIDASKHQWMSDCWHDLIVILDDATSEIYYAQLVDEESTRTVMAGLRVVVENRGWFSSIYSDRASHFFKTPKAGQAIDTRDVTQVGRAMRDLGIRMIPAYSPQARGRSERGFRTWQGRLPQELRVSGIATVEQANRFLRDTYIAEFNSKFTVTASEEGTAFMPLHRQDLDRVFAIQHERSVNKDNTIQFANHVWQMPKTPLRVTLSGCQVLVYEHLDGTFTVGYGPHTLARFAASGEPIETPLPRRPRQRPGAGRASASTSPSSALRAPLGLRSSRRSSGTRERENKETIQLLILILNSQRWKN